MIPDFRPIEPGLDRRQLLQGAAGGALIGAAATVLASLPRSARASSADPIQVGGLPVTCNLTLPVACTARAMENGSGPHAIGDRVRLLSHYDPELTLAKNRLLGCTPRASRSDTLTLYRLSEHPSA